MCGSDSLEALTDESPELDVLGVTVTGSVRLAHLVHRVEQSLHGTREREVNHTLDHTHTPHLLDRGRVYLQTKRRREQLVSATAVLGPILHNRVFILLTITKTHTSMLFTQSTLTKPTFIL